MAMHYIPFVIKTNPPLQRFASCVLRADATSTKYIEKAVNGKAPVSFSPTIKEDPAGKVYINARQEEAQLYVPKIPIYKGESYLKLQEFTRACEHMYETRPVTYRSVKDQVMLAKGNLQDSPRNAWYRVPHGH